MADKLLIFNVVSMLIVLATIAITGYALWVNAKGKNPVISRSEGNGMAIVSLITFIVLFLSFGIILFHLARRGRFIWNNLNPLGN